MCWTRRVDRGERKKLKVYVSRSHARRVARPAASCIKYNILGRQKLRNKKNVGRDARTTRISIRQQGHSSGQVSGRHFYLHFSAFKNVTDAGRTNVYFFCFGPHLHLHSSIVCAVSGRKGNTYERVHTRTHLFTDKPRGSDEYKTKKKKTVSGFEM